MHLLYSLIALMLVGVLALNSMRTATHAEQRILSNEIMTQVTGVADEVFDHAAGYWFDHAVDESRSAIQPPIFPLIEAHQTNLLTATSAVPGATVDGWGGCTDAIYAQDTNMGQRRLQNTARPLTCDDVDDLHGLSIEMERDGLTYDVAVAVEYVLPTDPTVVSSSPTFAKRLTLTITSADYEIGGSPLEVVLSRAFMYDRVTGT